MTLDELSDLLRAGEGERAEFKRALPDGDDVATTLAAFANSMGGVLLIGIDDDGQLVGVDKPDETAQRIASLTRDACRPPLAPRIGQLHFGRLSFVWAEVATQPGRSTLVHGIRYIRVGPTTRADHLGITAEAIEPRVPPVVDRFRGRDSELQKLRQDLVRGGSHVLVIEGISGIGKTALAAKLFKLMEGDGYRALWLDCHGETTFDDLRLELSCVARANAELALAVRLDDIVESSSRNDRVVDVLSALSHYKYALFLDDYHRVIDPLFDDFLTEFAHRSGHSRAILCVSRRPRLLDVASPANRKEEYIADGLAPEACERFLRDAGISVAVGEPQKVYTVCGCGHPKALSLFAALAVRIPVAVLLRNLPRFEETLRDEWLTPLLQGLSEELRQLVVSLAIFERRIPVKALRHLYPSSNVEALLHKLAQSFIIDYDGTEHVRMHDLLRQACYKFIGDARQRHAEAGSLYLRECPLDADASSDHTIELLVSAWAHFIQAEDAVTAVRVLEHLRPLLMQRGKYDQLLLLMDQTPTIEPEWRAIYRARIFGLWGEVNDAVALLDPLLMSDDKGISAEAALVLAAIYNSQGRSTDALNVLTARFSRGRVSTDRSVRLLSRVAEAYLISGNPIGALDLLAQIKRLCQEREDRLGDGIATRLMAAACLAQGEAKRGLKCALDSYKLLKNWTLEAARSEIQVGLAWAALGEREHALETLEEANRTLLEVGDRTSSALCRRHIAKVRKDAGGSVNLAGG